MMSPEKHPTDEDLMTAMRSGTCEQSFEYLLERYADRAFRLASGQLGSHQAAEDAIQETFLRLIKFRKSYKPGMKFAP